MARPTLVYRPRRCPGCGDTFIQPPLPEDLSKLPAKSIAAQIYCTPTCGNEARRHSAVAIDDDPWAGCVPDLRSDPALARCTDCGSTMAYPDQPTLADRLMRPVVCPACTLIRLLDIAVVKQRKADRARSRQREGRILRDSLHVRRLIDPPTVDA